MTDAECLRRAAEILKGRSTRPSGTVMRLLCDILVGQANKIDDEQRLRS